MAAKTTIVRSVERQSSKYQEAQEKTRGLRDSLDARILDARAAGATYRELSAATGLSTAWVQNALLRAGYKTKPRAKKR